MAGDLDQISEAIGALRAMHTSMLDTQRDRWEETRRQHQDLRAEIIGLNAKLAPIAALAKDVAEMKPAVRDWQMTKQRAVGIVAVLSLIFTGIGFLIELGGSWILKKFGW